MPTPTLVNSRSPIPVQADRMNRIENRLARLDQQIATGEKFTEAAEDPAGAARVALLQRMQARLDADEKAVNRANDRLSLAETAIATGADAVLRARDLALTASNGSSSAETRQVILAEVQVLRQQLLEAANSRDEGGRYIFAGSRGSAPAFAADADGVIQWQGFAAAPGAEAAGIATAAPPAGPELFGDAETGAFAQLQALEAALQEPDADLRASALNSVLEGLQPAHDRLVTGQAKLGAGMARLAVESERIATARLNSKEALTNAKGLDLTQAFTELEALKLTLSAAQGSFTAIYDGTLFDRLG